MLEWLSSISGVHKTVISSSRLAVKPMLRCLSVVGFISSRIAGRIAVNRLIELIEVLSDLSVRDEQLVHTAWPGC